MGLNKVLAKKMLAQIQSLKHTKGEWAGKPFVLEPWQRDEVFVPLLATTNGDGLRQYRTAYVEIPRKNGKSEMAAALALYLLVADGEPGAEIYSAAAGRDQATLVFNVAAQMVRQDPLLNKRLKIIDSQKRIIYPKTSSFYRAVCSEVAGLHGLNASGIIFDELHVQPNRELWDVLATSTGARRQPLTFAITTAGYDRNSICWELHDYALKVRDGILDDPTFLPVIYAAPEDADWTDPKVWAAANPNLGVCLKEEYLQQECAKAQETPAYENTFRRLHLNQWTEQETRWMAMEKWDACEVLIDPAHLKGKQCYAGLDLASTTDIAAFVLVFPPQDGLDEYAVLPFFFVPEEGMRARVKRDRVPYDVWHKQGFIFATPGETIDYDFINNQIQEARKKYVFKEIEYDQWNAEMLMQRLEKRGFKGIKNNQQFGQIAVPTKELMTLVLKREIAHGGNPVLRWMASNLVVKQNPDGNVKPDKSKSTEKIDGMVALIMGLDRAIRHRRSAPMRMEWV